jgi:hypothetical protein
VPQVTPTKAIPYAIGTDFSDPRALRDLALVEDASFAAYDAAFAAGPRPPAFMCRSGANGTAVTSGQIPAIASAVVEWNTSGGVVSVGGTWTQGANDPLTWWMFGLNIFEAQVTGAGAVGTALEATLIVSSIDPVTGLQSSTALGDGNQFYTPPFGQNAYSTEAIETGTGAHWFTGFCILPLYKAIVVPVFWNRDTGGAQTKQTLTGTVFWGVRLGAV